MLTMDQVHRIRDLYYGQGITDLAEIARREDCDWRTVRKYVDMEDFSPKPPKPANAGEDAPSKLNKFKPLIDKWLTDDKKAPRKQRHTAKRVFRRLEKEAEGFDCSYRLVAGYVAEKKKQLGTKREIGYIPLIHQPGEAQADFGYADFIENGMRHREAKYLVLSFPFSNGGYLQLNYGENLECLMEGLQAMFEYIGGVPTEIWFDNTKTIVTKIIRGGGRDITERFQRFCEHYRFQPVFTNPASGNEKGNVENKVGYLRRNELVPVPEFKSLKEKNLELLARCDADMEREHYDSENGTFISELFLKDKAALLPLPAVPFDTALYTSARTNKYGRFTLDNGKHEYSASPAICEDVVQLKITSGEVVVMDTNMREIVRHKRLYGNQPARSMQWVPYLSYIARKPRSLRNSGIYDLMPPELQHYIDICPQSDRGKILKVLAELTDRSGFESALDTVNQAIRYSATDPDSLKTLYQRTYSDAPQLPPLPDETSVPSVKIVPFRNDLKALDSVLQKGGVVNV